MSIIITWYCIHKWQREKGFKQTFSEQYEYALKQLIESDVTAGTGLRATPITRLAIAVDYPHDEKGMDG